VVRSQPEFNNPEAPLAQPERQDVQMRQNGSNPFLAVRPC
jgi:hypothetical protein